MSRNSTKGQLMTAIIAALAERLGEHLPGFRSIERIDANIIRLSFDDGTNWRIELNQADEG